MENKKKKNTRREQKKHPQRTNYKPSKNCILQQIQSNPKSTQRTSPEALKLVF